MATYDVFNPSDFVSAFPIELLREDGTVNVNVNLVNGKTITDKWFTLEQASKLLGEKESSIRTATQKGEIPSAKANEKNKPSKLVVSLECTKAYFAQTPSGKESKVWVVKDLLETEVMAMVKAFNDANPGRNVTAEKRYKPVG